MDIIHAIVLGILQGIGEFLPISSSGHLIVVPYLLNWQEHSLAFDVALHFGTLVAVLAVFWKDWFNLAKGATEKIIHKKDSFENKMFWYLVIATIPGALIGKIFESQVESIFRNPSYIYIIAISLAVMGLFIYLGDKWAQKKYEGSEVNYEDLTLKQTLIIGLSQALAVIPGFSRSGTTMLTARLMGVTREAAAKFTFLLSVPIITGAALLKLPDMIEGFSIELLIGMIVSAIVGVLSIKFLLKYIKNHDFAIFAYYRFIIAIVILVKFFIFS